MSRRHTPRDPRWAARGAEQPPGPPSGGPRPDRAAPPPRKRRRVFLAVFLAVQLLFLVSVVVAALSGTGTPGECRGPTGEELEVCEDASTRGPPSACGSSSSCGQRST
jgi:hypothetical protein